MNPNVILADSTKEFMRRYMGYGLINQTNLLFSIIQDLDERILALEKRPRPGRKPAGDKTNSENGSKANAKTT